MPNSTSSTARIYHAPDRESHLSDVAGVVCVLQPRALLIAGLAEGGEVLMIHEDSYTADEGTEWMPSFFEKHFVSDALLGGPQPVAAVAIYTEEQMLVPDELQAEKENREWLRRIFLLEPDTEVRDWHSKAEEVNYLYTVPAEIARLLKRYFEHVPQLPLAAYQFYKPATDQQAMLQCVLTDGKATATLRRNGKLLWHQSFDGSTAENIAWQLSHLCRQQKLAPADLKIEFCTTSGMDELLNEVETFFPKLTRNSHSNPEEGEWGPVICLLQQLYACAL